MVLYTITGLLLAWLAYMNKDHLPMCLWLCLTSAWLLFNVLRSIILKVSSTAIIERDKKRSVRFKKGVRYLTRSQLIDLLSSYFGYNVKLFPSQHLYLSRLLAKWV